MLVWRVINILDFSFLHLQAWALDFIITGWPQCISVSAVSGVRLAIASCQVTALSPLSPSRLRPPRDLRPPASLCRRNQRNVDCRYASQPLVHRQFLITYSSFAHISYISCIKYIRRYPQFLIKTSAYFVWKLSVWTDVYHYVLYWFLMFLFS